MRDLPAENTQDLPPLLRTVAVFPCALSVFAADLAAVLVVWQDTFEYFLTLVAMLTIIEWIKNIALPHYQLRGFSPAQPERLV